jgi:lipid-A-disaccharide synthase
MADIVLVSNGPGELYTWVRPVLTELRRQAPEQRVTVSLVPCQFASGQETRIAETFGADSVTSPNDFVRLLAGDRSAFGGRAGAVLGLGGGVGLALGLAERLKAPTFRYSFVPYWNKKLTALFVDAPAHGAAGKASRRSGGTGGGRRQPRRRRRRPRRARL